MVHAGYGNIGKRKNGELMLKISGEGFKIIKEQKMKAGNTEADRLRIEKNRIIETDLYVNAKKYGNRGNKKRYFNELVKDLDVNAIDLKSNTND